MKVECNDTLESQAEKGVIKYEDEVCDTSMRQ